MVTLLDILKLFREPKYKMLCAGLDMYQEIGNYIIRDWEIEDSASLAKYANNKRIRQNLRDGFPNPYSIQDAAKFIARVTKLFQEPFLQ